MKFRRSYGIVLHMIDADDDLDRIVLPLGASIRASIARIDEAGRSDDEMTAELDYGRRVRFDRGAAWASLCRRSDAHHACRILVRKTSRFAFERNREQIVTWD